MTTVNASNFAAQLPALLELVRNGESVLVTENDQPVAQLGPVPEADEEDDGRPWRGTYDPPIVVESVPLDRSKPQLRVVEREVPEVDSSWIREADHDD